MLFNNKGVIFCIIAALSWGSIGVFVKKIGGITPIGIAFFRLLIAFFVIILIGIFSHNSKEIKETFIRWKLFLLLSFLMSIHFVFSIAGFDATTVANASILGNTSAFIVPLLAFVIGERINVKEWLGIMIGFLGIILIFSFEGISLLSDHFLGNVYVLLAALILSVYILINRKIRNTYSSIAIMFWIFGLGSVFILLESILIKQPLVTSPTINDWYYMIGLGIIGTFIGHTLFNSSLKYIKSSTATIIAIFSPLSAIVYANIFLHEIPSIIVIIGFLLSIIGVVMVVKTNKLQKCF